MLMTPVAPSQVLCKASIAYTSILIQVDITPVQTVVSTTLLVIRVHLLMTQVSSTAHMYPFRWYVQLVRTPSNQKLASRPVMVWLPTHSQKVWIKVSEDCKSMQTVTTEEFKSRTSCDSGLHISSEGLSRPSFFI
jgi:hypothetical protein